MENPRLTVSIKKYEIRQELNRIPWLLQVNAISDAIILNDIKERQLFLGVPNFLSKFPPNLAKILLPFYCLQKKENLWKCSGECDQIFE